MRDAAPPDSPKSIAGPPDGGQSAGPACPGWALSLPPDRSAKGQEGSSGRLEIPHRRREGILPRRMGRKASAPGRRRLYGFLATIAAEAWAVGMTIISLMLTCGGRVAHQTAASAISSGERGLKPW